MVQTSPIVQYKKEPPAGTRNQNITSYWWSARHSMMGCPPLDMPATCSPGATEPGSCYARASVDAPAGRTRSHKNLLVTMVLPVRFSHNPSSRAPQGSVAVVRGRQPSEQLLRQHTCDVRIARLQALKIVMHAVDKGPLGKGPLWTAIHSALGEHGPRTPSCGRRRGRSCCAPATRRCRPGGSGGGTASRSLGSLPGARSSSQ